jgi:hypothetical protein
MYPALIAARLEAFMNSPIRRTLVFSGLAGILVGIAEAVAWDWMLQHVWQPVLDGARSLMILPMGYGGVIVLACLTLAILSALFDTSPTAVVIGKWLHDVRCASWTRRSPSRAGGARPRRGVRRAARSLRPPPTDARHAADRSVDQSPQTPRRLRGRPSVNSVHPESQTR